MLIILSPVLRCVLTQHVQGVKMSKVNMLFGSIQGCLGSLVLTGEGGEDV